MKLTDLRVNHVAEPMGFHMEPLSFSWKVSEAGHGKKQQYARIKIYEGETEESELVFDSGEDTSADSLDYRAGLELKPRTRYTWHLEVKADDGESAGAVSHFETGKGKEDWIGKWITADMDADTPSVLQKTFQAEMQDTKKTARLYICALGVYEVYLNGKKVGNEYLAPGYHSYDFHLQAQTYDVTEELKEGENELRIWTGDGWFRGRLGFDGGFTNLYGEKCYAIAELHCGGKLLAATDATWKSKPSPVVFSNIYDGEIYDAGKEAFLKEEEGWNGVREELPGKCGMYAGEADYRILHEEVMLGDRYSLPVVKKEAIKPVEMIHTPAGEEVLDFGQNLTGWVEFDCALPKDTKIRLTAAEILQDGCFYHENLRTAKTEFTYISDGKERHVRPHFTFFGFRYMKVEYFDAEGQEQLRLETEAFTAYHLRSDFDQIGKITTGNEKVNKLFSNALWGQKDNFLDVPTDCPQRDERLGWTGDAQIFSETACYNMYMPAFYRKYLWDMRAEQSILGGSGPNVVPRLKEGMVAEHGSCPWADAAVIIPWNVYRHYGSRTLLEECYPGMKAWVECERRAEEAEGGPHRIKGGFHFADWLALDNEQPGPFGATDPLYIASAYYYRCAKIVAESAAELGYQTDAEEYETLSAEILKAIQETWFDEKGLCTCHTQTGSAIAVMFGLHPGKENLEGQELNRRVEENQQHLNTGFVGTTMLCPALTKTEFHKTAVDLLLNEEYPGWLYSVNMGATTIWERWNSVEPDGHLNPEGMNSLNHYSYGSIEAWMYGYVCGIRETAPGFREAVIEPHPDVRLGFADCRLDTAVGEYISSWKYNTDGTITYKVVIPFGASAVVQTGHTRKELEAGSYEWTEKSES